MVARVGPRSNTTPGCGRHRTENGTIGVVLDRHDVQSVEGGHVGDRRLAPSIGEQPVGDLEPMARDANVADRVAPRSSHSVGLVHPL